MDLCKNQGEGQQSCVVDCAAGPRPYDACASHWEIAIGTRRQEMW